MLLLTFLLIPTLVAASTKIVGDYAITMDKNVLTTVFPRNSNEPNKYLNLSNQHISSIAEGAFVSVSNIKTLDLSKNDISTVHHGVFSNLQHLNHLSLAGNALKNFYKAFEGLRDLKSLDISDSSIKQLGNSDFFGIPKSVNIDTTRNKLETISRALFEETYANSFAQAIICQHEGIVSSLEHWPNTKPLSTGCTRVQIDSAYPHWIRLHNLGISGFDKDWYRLYNTEVYGMYLRGNNIVDINPKFVNCLPYRLKYLDLSNNKIERVTKGSIVLRNLAGLDLSENEINEIADDAFKHTSLEWIILDTNRLDNVRFVPTLPRNLSVLSLRNNQISELQPSECFSTLRNLTYLHLGQNRITELKRSNFVGLQSLRNFTLELNELQNLDSDCFANLPNLQELNLNHNKLTNMGYGVFHPVTNIVTLNLQWNKLSTLYRFMFSPLKRLKHLYIGHNAFTNLNRSLVGLSSLEDLDISYNPIASATKEDFSGIPLTIGLSMDTATSLAISRAHMRGFRGADDSIVSILLCMNAGTVTTVRQMTEKDTPMPSQCREIRVEKNWKPSKGETTLNLAERGISGFAKNWYRLEVPITTIVLDSNGIVDVTSEMFNDLPKNVNYIYMRYNRIGQLKKGVIVNEHLRSLNLDGNVIREIEENAFVNTKLSELIVSFNLLRGTQFVAGMPTSLTRLDASSNVLEQIPAGTFSRLDKLKFLYIEYSQLNNIGSESFRGLSSLKTLSLEGNKLMTIDKDAFQHTKMLKKLNLSSNKLQKMDKPLFSNLDKLSDINLAYNQFSDIMKETLPDFPDSLESLDLRNNNLRYVEAGSFIGGPKYELLLQNNELTTIYNGAFNFPDLVVLHLENNQLNRLNRLNGDAFKDMPNLEELYLNENRITKIDKGAAKYLNKLYMLDLSNNPIKTLNNGDLFGLSNLPSQKYEALIRVNKMPLEHIGGDLFNDESKL